MGRSASCVGPQHNHAKSALRGTCAPWAVGRYSAGREARGSRVEGFEYGGHDLPKPVPPTRRGVGAVEPGPTARGGARHALAHNTTTPSLHWTEHILRGRSAEAPQGKKRAGRASRVEGFVTIATNRNPKVRKSGAVATTVLAPMVLEEEGSIRAARGEDLRDIRRANHLAKGPAPPESILSRCLLVTCYKNK